MVIYNMYIFKISPHRWSSMVVGSKRWAERRYIREVKDVQRTSNTSRILKDIQEAFSGSNTEGQKQCLQSQRRRFYAPRACRGAITVPTVATSEVLRSEFEVPHTTRFQGHRQHRAVLRHPFVRTRTKTKHLHNAKKGLCVDSKLLRGPGGF